MEEVILIWGNQRKYAKGMLLKTTTRKMGRGYLIKHEHYDTHAQKTSFFLRRSIRVSDMSIKRREFYCCELGLDPCVTRIFEVSSKMAFVKSIRPATDFTKRHNHHLKLNSMSEQYLPTVISTELHPDYYCDKYYGETPQWNNYTTCRFTIGTNQKHQSLPPKRTRITLLELWEQRLHYHFTHNDFCDWQEIPYHIKEEVVERYMQGISTATITSRFRIRKHHIEMILDEFQYKNPRGAHYKRIEERREKARKALRAQKEKERVEKFAERRELRRMQFEQWNQKRTHLRFRWFHMQKRLQKNRGLTPIKRMQVLESLCSAMMPGRGLHTLKFNPHMVAEICEIHNITETIINGLWNDFGHALINSGAVSQWKRYYFQLTENEVYRIIYDINRCESLHEIALELKITQDLIKEVYERFS